MVDISVIEKNALVQTRQSDRPAVGLLKHGWRLSNYKSTWFGPSAFNENHS